MKTYIKPTMEFILLEGERDILEKVVLNYASVYDTDAEKTEVLPIEEGDPDEWGGDAKGWNCWDLE